MEKKCRMANSQFDLFVSYSRHDQDIVYDIAGRLRAMGLSIFLDAWKIRPFERLVDQLQDGIQNARSCLIFFSEHAARSPWVLQECNSLITRAITQTGFGIFTIRLDNTDLPLFLRDWPWQDLGTATDAQIEDFVGMVARELGVRQGVVDGIESHKIWTSPSELSTKLFFTLLSLGLDRKEFKPIWRIATSTNGAYISSIGR
jgi:hypothetical protein